MDGDTIAQVIEALRAREVRTLDLKGGAPEPNGHFRQLVQQARALRLRVICRRKRNALSQPGQEGLAPFLAAKVVKGQEPLYRDRGVDVPPEVGPF